MTVNITAVKQRLPASKKLSARAPSSEVARKRSRGRYFRGRGFFGWLPAIVALALVVIGLAFWYQAVGNRRAAAPTRRYVLTRSYPHAVDAYCQGLVYRDGFLYEGTGAYGKSSLRKVELATGKVLQERRLDNRLFGEGITIWENQVIQLTWKSRQALVYDLETFQVQGRFSYRGEGWGITHDGKQLIMSDGTATLRFLDPKTFRVRRQLTVRDGRRRVSKLNELEFVEGDIYANIWYEDRIARISSETGKVIEWLDLSQLYPSSQRHDRDEVLNGIAYDPQQRRLLVTGKNWPRLYEIHLPE